jgi:hypothetical protein
MKPTRPDIAEKIEHRTWRLTIMTCPKCGALVMQGRDGGPVIHIVTVDPGPISQLGEAMALVDGRNTYDLYRVNGGLELHPRSAAHVRAGHKRPVVTDHRCGAEPLPAADLPPPPRAKPEPQSFVPPF